MTSATSATSVLVVTIDCLVESQLLFFNYLINQATLTTTEIVVTTKQIVATTYKQWYLFGEPIAHSRLHTPNLLTKHINSSEIPILQYFQLEFYYLAPVANIATMNLESEKLVATSVLVTTI